MNQATKTQSKLNFKATQSEYFNQLIYSARVKYGQDKKCHFNLVPHAGWIIT